MEGNSTCSEFMMQNMRFTAFNYWSMVLSWLAIPVAVLGIIGSGTIIGVRLSHGMKSSQCYQSSVNFLMIALAIADGGMLLFAALAVIPMGLYDYYSFAGGWKALELYTVYASKYLYPIAVMFHTASIYVLALITLERYIGLCYPLHARAICTTSNARRGTVAGVSFIGLVLLFSIFYNLPRFFEYDFTIQNGTVSLRPGLAPRHLGAGYARIYTMWLYLIVMFALPFLFMLLLNTKILLELRASRRRRITMGQDQDVGERSTTVMLCVVTVVFLLSNTLPFALRIWDVSFCEQILSSLARKDVLPWTQIMEEISRLTGSYPNDQVAMLLSLSTLLVFINSAVNLPIYCIFNARFRTAFIRLFARGKEPRWV